MYQNKKCLNCKRVKMIKVKIPADLSCTGKTKWKRVSIDYCIAPIVKALQGASIDMRGSCCGHGKQCGNIHLQDNRVLIISQYVLYDNFRKLIDQKLTW
jgi:hypothetical protein